MGHHDLQNQPRPTREIEGDGERETVGGRESRSCSGLFVCEKRFMRVGNKKFFFSLTSSYNELLEIVATVTH